MREKVKMSKAVLFMEHSLFFSLKFLFEFLTLFGIALGGETSRASYVLMLDPSFP